MQEAHKLGDRFIPINIEGHGKNALDFHIAFYLGEQLAKTPHVTCVILSKDKGFDPLGKHLSNRGLRVRRVNDVGQAFPRAPSQSVAESTKQPIDALQSRSLVIACTAQALFVRFRRWLFGHVARIGFVGFGACHEFALRHCAVAIGVQSCKAGRDALVARHFGLADALIVVPRRISAAGPSGE